MSKEVYREELERRLGALDARLDEAEEMLVGGRALTKVEAAGEIAILKDRRRALAAKLARLEREPEGTWEGLKTEIEEDYDAVVEGPDPRLAVPAATDGEIQPGLACEVQAGHHVAGVRGPNDHRGSPVDHRVEHRSRLVVAGVTRADQLAADLSS